MNDRELKLECARLIIPTFPNDHGIRMAEKLFAFVSGTNQSSVRPQEEVGWPNREDRLDLAKKGIVPGSIAWFWLTNG